MKVFVPLLKMMKFLEYRDNVISLPSNVGGNQSETQNDKRNKNVLMIK